MTLKGQTRDPDTLRAQYLEKTGFRDSIQKDHQWETAHGLSNSRVTDDVT